MPWILWLAVAAALGVAEFVAPTLALGLLAVAAVVAAVAAGLGGPLLVQVLAFAITGAAALVVVRPVARRHMAHPPLVREGSDALIGKTAVVAEEVTAVRGLIRLSGEDWSARSFDEHQVIPAGARVTVLEIEGASAVVYPESPAVDGTAAEMPLR
jgi:membrane protein implicated in regulation of membrane protease activity